MESLRNYIDALWPRLVRFVPNDDGTLIGLPRPFVVPADSDSSYNAMMQEMYYWDSYFIALGLVGTAHEHLIADMAENMLALQDRFGIIPNASRFYFLSRSQPPLLLDHLGLAVEVLRRRGDEDGGTNLLRRGTAAAICEHEQVWLGTAQPHHRCVYKGLSRYFDINYLHVLASCESGWDHSTRCDDRWLDFVPVDLNAILYQREVLIAKNLVELGETAKAKDWERRAQTRRQTMHEVFWSDDLAAFVDVDYTNETRSDHMSLAMFFPMWAGLATEHQAHAMVERWLPEFLQSGGVVTTLEHGVEKQWSWPNGWAPLQWFVVSGLDRYGFGVEADDICRRWMATVEHRFSVTGKCFEKYNVVDPLADVESGVYGQLSGFGWTNAVYLDFARRLADRDARR